MHPISEHIAHYSSKLAGHATGNDDVTPSPTLSKWLHAWRDTAASSEFWTAAHGAFSAAATAISAAATAHDSGTDASASGSPIAFCPANGQCSFIIGNKCTAAAAGAQLSVFANKCTASATATAAKLSALSIKCTAKATAAKLSTTDEPYTFTTNGTESSHGISGSQFIHEFQFHPPPPTVPTTAVTTTSATRGAISAANPNRAQRADHPHHRRPRRERINILSSRPERRPHVRSEILHQGHQRAIESRRAEGDRSGYNSGETASEIGTQSRECTAIEEEEKGAPGEFSR